MSIAPFTAEVRITRMEVEAVRVSVEELRSYLDVVGQDADLDGEEMPQSVLRDVVVRLDGFLARADKVLDADA